MFDLTWFWSHMFPASGEHSLLPPFVWQGGVQGYWQQFRGLTDTLGTELAACCTGWVEQSFPRQCWLQESPLSLQLSLPPSDWVIGS